jgi:hypothetical protein
MTPNMRALQRNQSRYIPKASPQSGFSLKEKPLQDSLQGHIYSGSALYGEGAAEGASRVLRGGSWNNDNTDNFRCAYRNNNKPDNRNNNNGFRCASTLDAGVRSSTEAGACARESRLLPGCSARDGRIHKRDRGAGSRGANATRFREF